MSSKRTGSPSTGKEATSRSSLTRVILVKAAPLSFGIMTLIGVIGTPLVLIYTVAVYWTFRGKVQLDDHSY
jgi:cytochrome bd-type quinol oxidase subunit 2